MQSSKSSLKGNILLLITATVWGFSFSAQSVGMEKLTACQFIGFRTVLGSLVLVPFAVKSSKTSFKKEGTKKATFIGGLICGIILFIASTLQTHGMKFTSAGKSAFITAIYIVLVPIAYVILGKKINKRIVISVIIAVLGLYLLCVKESITSVSGSDLLILLSAFFFTAHILAIDHFIKKADGVIMACLQFAVAGIIALIIMLIFETPNYADVFSCWIAIGYSGIFSCGVGYTLQIIGQKYTDPTSASLLMSLESVFGVLGGWMILGQTLTLKEIAGCAIMFFAIILIQLPNKKQL